MSSRFTESVVEEAALEWFGELGYSIVAGPEIAPRELLAERDTFSDAILTKRLEAALYSLNKKIPNEAIDEALRKISRAEASSLIANNRAFHRMLVDGVFSTRHSKLYCFTNISYSSACEYPETCVRTSKNEKKKPLKWLRLSVYSAARPQPKGRGE